jgi:hypothetical protein
MCCRAIRRGKGNTRINIHRLPVLAVALFTLLLAAPPGHAADPRQTPAVVQRNSVYHLVGPYNIDFYRRHNPSYRTGAAIHYAHARQHDYLQLTPLAQHEARDEAWNRDYLAFLRSGPRIEPSMEYYGPYIGRAMWNLYLAIDWTHMHHEQTYDIMSARDVPWDKKKQWTDRAVRYYVEKMPGIARSIAPLDVTMRRAGVMMKPYFSYFRNYYPNSNNFFYWAHWWHPAIYEAQMIAGNDAEQDQAVAMVEGPVAEQVQANRPLRMELSREIMPRYARMSPESANIFDNLHMLHGISYDILAYEGWTIEQKRAEMYRVIKAMAYQPGDENYVRKFPIPYPDMDPRVYADWMRGADGEMSRIMREMLHEMMPLMMADGMTPEMEARVMRQFMMKLTPGFQEGEHEGSLADALNKEMPGMTMMPEAMEPGATPAKMIEAMLEGWRQKYADMPDAPPIPMEQDPDLPPLPQEVAGASMPPR